MKLRSLLALSLLCLIPAGNAEPQISVSIPSLLKSGETGKACLTVKRHTNPMRVLAILEVGETNYTVIDEQVPAGDIFKTYELQVPKVEVPTPVFFLVRAVSGNYNYTARRSVVLAPTGNVAFIRTDKELYKGGQKVQMYVMSMDNNLRPVEETFPEIYVMDPAGNRIHQWLDQSTMGSFLYLSFMMLDDPDLGHFQIIANRQSGTPVTKSIKVEQYALPKFSLMLEAPNSVTILDKNVSVEVNARYTYDQGVPGQISGRLCRPPANYYNGNTCNRSPDGICVPFTGTTNSEGTFKGNVDLSTFQLDRSGYQMTFNMQVTLIEQGTNVQATETKAISITSQLGRARFDLKAMLPYFKKGIPYPVGIIVENAQGQPESGQVVELQMDGKVLQNLTSDKYGKAHYKVDTSTFATSNVNFQLSYKNQEQCYDNNWIVPTYSNDHHSVGRFFSRTESFVQLQGPKEDLQCGKTHNIRVQYIFGKDALAAGETTINFVYMVIARARIMETGVRSVDVSRSLKGEFNLTYKASPDHVPIVQYAIQYMLKDELVGDAINLNLEKCFKNQVSANFTSATETPGALVGLEVKTTSDSSCLIRVFDSSLLLLDAGQAFSAATVYNSLQYTSLNGYYAAGFNVQPPQVPCTDKNKQILVNGTYWQPVGFPGEEDVSKVYSGIGMHVITDTPSQQPQLCSQPDFFRPARFEQPSMGVSGIIFSASDSNEASVSTSTFTVSENAVAPLTSMRTYFPELWFFGTTYVRQNGTISVLEVPGTITKWKSDVVCLSNATGFGMTKYPANFTSFQKMFVDLSLPDSIVRGEIMLLVGSVANYMDKCAKVQVTLQSSSDYAVKPVHTESVKCVCSQKRVSYSWKINATSIGVANVSVTAETIHIGASCEGPADPREPKRKDTIVRSFTVEPEGIKQEVTKTDFVCVKGSNSIVNVNINPSGNIVPRSMFAKVQVIGDMLGRALTNPENLIVEPRGCGEQNLATLMPIVRAMEFLNLTGRLTEEIRQRAVQYMANGYVRQVRFRNYDGSFGAFSPGRSKPSGWLTVLALKTLWDIRPYTFVDDNIFKQGLIFLENLQDLNTGGFKPVGTLFNSGLKGGADDDVGFTCAVVIFMAQTTYASTPSLLRLALSYLDAASQKDQSVFNYAMLYNAFRVSGNVNRANAMRAKLKTLAINEGNSLYWQRKKRPEQQTPYLFSRSAPSAELELTATVLKAMAYGENSSTVSPNDLNEMAKISNWLVRQQNIHGSYRTTSDTMAVLDALCSYGALVYQNNARNTVQLKYGDRVIREFNVSKSSRILLQSEILNRVPGNYSMVVSGNGCVLLQTGVEFNVPVRQRNSAFSLSVTTFPGNCQNGVAYLVDCQVNASYRGIQNTSNMALIDVPLLSGYIVEDNSLSKLKSMFPKVEQMKNHLIVYLNDMTSEGVSFNVTQEMRPRVENFQPRTVRVYDYYEKDENGSAELRHPCTLSG
ncbi:alpha-2-macroglobulin-like [Rana temporaria]|uniref:alpha-2-macroglobulin-like n=1 Tax=Rana temporaria TaxID=8407 RepID=UPI001AADF155|nr:alpha-2-macroglobulin-like [Rana temporaria]XP_040217677.1 alpha-2-macroglobulin-like [Rana temporaria]